MVARPLLSPTGAAVATPWSGWPVVAIASWSWARATIRFRNSHMSSFNGLRREAIRVPLMIADLTLEYHEHRSEARRRCARVGVAMWSRLLALALLLQPAQALA